MGKHTRHEDLRAHLKGAGADLSGRQQRAKWSLPIFSTLASFAFIAVFLVPPLTPSSSALAVGITAGSERRVIQSQSIVAAGARAESADRDVFSITDPIVATPVVQTASAAPAAGTPDPGSAQAVAQGILASMGMGTDQYSCLVALWNRESGWNIYAYNASSGAYGIPQSLPGDKMASAGADWATNPATQISWGLGYITSRYSTPCGAWEHSESRGWY